MATMAFFGRRLHDAQFLFHFLYENSLRSSRAPTSAPLMMGFLIFFIKSNRNCFLFLSIQPLIWWPGAWRRKRSYFLNMRQQWVCAITSSNIEWVVERWRALNFSLENHGMKKLGIDRFAVKQCDRRWYQSLGESLIITFFFLIDLEHQRSDNESLFVSYWTRRQREVSILLIHLMASHLRIIASAPSALVGFFPPFPKRA